MSSNIMFMLIIIYDDILLMSVWRLRGNIAFIEVARKFVRVS
jgi:hypothetical protein